MNNKIIIRNATKDDARQITEIIVEDWKKAYSGIIDQAFLDTYNVEERYEIEVKRFDKYYVAVLDNEVVGCEWLEMLEEEVSDSEIIALYVRYAKRNMGIGKLLFEYAMRHFKESGRKKMIIWCLKDNQEARKFYEKVGGKEFKTSTHNWGGKDYDMISYLYDL
ncbi:MAG: GNAT family N-acetyltransferase [Eubacterium sp.]|nr:GNAT family N-acetyltransferase [Eubacterium sp.]